jgi:hypothetical protein
MNIFTKKLMDWTLFDCIKATVGTIGVLYAVDKIYDRIQERKEANDIHYDETDYEEVQEEETSE